jgi:hypothetical protein
MLFHKIPKEPYVFIESENSCALPAPDNIEARRGKTKASNSLAPDKESFDRKL